MIGSVEGANSAVLTLTLQSPPLHRTNKVCLKPSNLSLVYVMKVAENAPAVPEVCRGCHLHEVWSLCWDNSIHKTLNNDYITYARAVKYPEEITAGYIFRTVVLQNLFCEVYSLVHWRKTNYKVSQHNLLTFDLPTKHRRSDTDCTFLWKRFQVVFEACIRYVRNNVNGRKSDRLFAMVSTIAIVQYCPSLT